MIQLAWLVQKQLNRSVKKNLKMKLKEKKEIDKIKNLMT
jgi:hypothetical protein